MAMFMVKSIVIQINGQNYGSINWTQDNGSATCSHSCMNGVSFAEETVIYHSTNFILCSPFHQLNHFRSWFTCTMGKPVSLLYVLVICISKCIRFLLYLLATLSPDNLSPPWKDFEWTMCCYKDKDWKKWVSDNPTLQRN